MVCFLSNKIQACVLFFFIIINSATAQLYINEVMPSNSRTIADPEYNSYPDWIELYNSSFAEIDLTGYYLTDNISNPTKWQFPDNTTIAGRSYLLIWADDVNIGLHTSFKLSASGEYVGLYNSNFELVDSITFPALPVDISYGRSIDGEFTMGIMANPSPGSANIDNIVRGTAPQPIFSVPAGFYSSEQTISLSTNLSGATIRFTTDGSMPTASSPIYTGEVTLRPITRQRQYREVDGTENVEVKARTLKARVFHPEYLPSRVVGNTYFINENNFSLPVVSLTANKDSLFGDDWGIYVSGNGNGLCGRGQTAPKNWNRDWKRAVYFEYFDNNKQQQLSQTCKASIMGGWSRAWDLKSLNIEADRRYDPIDRLNYKFFEHKNIDVFESIVLRNSGNDFNDNMTMMRDALTHALVRNTNIDYQEFSPVIVFINGEYWGIQNIRERMNKYYVQNNHPNVDYDNIDLIKNNYEDTFYDNCAPDYSINNIKEGDALNYAELDNYLRNNSLASTQNYQYIKSKIDIDEFINYNIVHTFVSNDDWPQNNTRYWRPRTEDGKWRWMLYDTDFGWGIWGRRPTEPTLLRALGEANASNSYAPPPEWATLVLSKLVENDEFVKEFVQRYMAFLGNVFTPQRIESNANQLANKIAPEIPAHFERWGKYNIWADNVQDMIDWANGSQYSISRIDYVKQELLDRFNYSETANLRVNRYGGGDVTINTCPVLYGEYSEYVSNIPVKLKAVPNPGYRFVRWMRITGEPQSTTIFPLGSEWKYHDRGIDLHSTNWKDLNFDDSDWDSGSGRLGYGGDGEVTVLSYGDDSQNKYPCYYFRKEIDIENNNTLSNLKIRTTFDDGIVVYVNGIEVYRYNMDSGDTYYEQLSQFAMNEPEETQIFEATIPSDVFVQGRNIIAVEIHQQSVSNSTDMGFDMALVSQSGLPTGTSLSTNSQLTINITSDQTIGAIFEIVEPASGIVINEILTSNSASLSDNAGQFDDWIEIYNSSDRAFDLGGCYISNNPDNKQLFRISTHFPDSTTIQPGEYKILWADRDLNQGVLHLDFKLSKDGGFIGLYQPSGDIINTLDEFSYQTQTTDISYGRYPNATGNRQALMPTPGTENSRLEIIENIYINEFVAANNGSHIDENGKFGDWIEIYNANSEPVNIGGLFITDNLNRPDKYRIPTDFPEQTTIPANGFVVLWADSDPTAGSLHLGFSLSASGEAVGIVQNTGSGFSFIDQISFGVQIPDVSKARFPDGTGNFVSTYSLTPGSSNVESQYEPITGLYINEIATSNSTYTDNRGQADDWIELYNSNDYDVNIGGLFITDSLGNKTLWRIPSVYPDSTIVPANGYYILWADDDTRQGVNHVGFKLSQNGESVGLYQADGNELITIDEITFGQQYRDITCGRYEDGNDSITFLNPTPLASNEKLDRRNIICRISTDIDTLNISLSPNQLLYEVILDAETRVLNEVEFLTPFDDVVIDITQPTQLQGGVAIAELQTIDGDIQYTINITKELSSDASLSSINASYGTLSPSFAPDIFEYYLVLEPSTATTIPVITVMPSTELALTGVSQANTIPGVATVNVVAEDGTTQVYYVYFEMSSDYYDIIPIQSVWKYNDLGIDIDTLNWKSLDFDDSEWSSGSGVLGYGDNQQTILNYGNNESEKYPCYYFRKTITVSDVDKLSDFYFTLRRDDGAVVFINEQEVYRVNMQDTTEVLYNHWALETCGDECEEEYTLVEVPDSLFVQGENVIAVRIHQDDKASTDISFDFSLSAVREIEISSSTQTISLKEGWNLISLNVVAYDMSPDSLFADILEKVEIIKGLSQFYVPNGVENTLNSFRDGRAYFVKMNSPADLVIEGAPLSGSNVSIMLRDGWNLVGYPLQAESNVRDALGGVLNRIRIVKHENEHFNPIFPDRVNSLEIFEPGKGYLFNYKLTAPFSFPNQ